MRRLIQQRGKLSVRFDVARFFSEILDALRLAGEQLRALLA